MKRMNVESEIQFWHYYLVSDFLYFVVNVRLRSYWWIRTMISLDNADKNWWTKTQNPPRNEKLQDERANNKRRKLNASAGECLTNVCVLPNMFVCVAYRRWPTEANTFIRKLGILNFFFMTSRLRRNQWYQRMSTYESLSILKASIQDWRRKSHLTTRFFFAYNKSLKYHFKSFLITEEIEHNVSRYI